MVSRTSCWGSLTRRRRRRTWSKRVKMAVFAPMPSAKVRTATVVKPGVRASMRKVYFRSRRTVSSQPRMVTRRVASLAVLVTGNPQATRGKDEESYQKFDESTKRFVDCCGEFIAKKWRKEFRRKWRGLAEGAELSRRWLWLPYECPGLRPFAGKRRRRGR